MKSEEIFYEPPMVDVTEVAIEKGFALSDTFDGSAPDSDDSEFGNYY